MISVRGDRMTDLRHKSAITLSLVSLSGEAGLYFTSTRRQQMSTENRFIITRPTFLVQADDAFVTNEPIPDEPSVNDVQAFATVGSQVTTDSTFSIDVVGGMVYPLHTDLDPVITRQSDGETYTATQRTLQYPGTAINSTHVYTATVNLELGENVFELPSGTGTRTMNVFRKTALEEVTATNQSELNSMTTTALSSGSTVDCVYIDFDNADLHAALAAAESGTSNPDREYWCRFKPYVGRTVNWNTDGAYSEARPQSTFICLEGITVGGPDQQQRGNYLYLDPNNKVWIRDCSITAKYDFDYVSIGVQGRTDFPPSHPESAPDGIGIDAVVDEDPYAFVRLAYVESYITGCSFTGLVQPMGGTAIIRDCSYNQMRCDIHANDGVALNTIVDDVLPIVVVDRDDWNHVDLYQRWGNAVNSPYGYHENLYWAGLLMRTNPETVGFESEVQVALFDRSIENTWNNMIWRDLDTTAYELDTAGNFIQFAGWATKFRIDNIQTSFNTDINFRSDYPPYPPTVENPDPIQPYAWTPTEVYIQNIQCGTLGLLYSEDTSQHVAFTAASADATTEINQQDPFVGQQFFPTTVIL